MSILSICKKLNISTEAQAIELIKKKYLQHTKTQIQNINIDNIFGINDISQIRKIINPANYTYDYVLLDTNNVNTDLSTDTTYGWQVVNYSTETKGSITIFNDKPLIGMRVYPMTTKLTAPVGETDKIYITNLVNLNYNFTVLIHEFQAQSYIGRDGRKFHFIYYPQLMNPDDSDRIKITPADPYIEFTTSGKMNGWFWFKDPIIDFSTLTISIGNPFNLVKLSQTQRTLIPIQFIFAAD